MSNNKIWINEDFFPEKGNYQCPPDNSYEFNGSLYRFCCKDVPCIEDFSLASSRENFRNKHKNNFKLLCQGSGFSSYLSFDDAESNLLKMRKGVKGVKKKYKGILEVEITEKDGVVAETPSKNTVNHHTWWMKESSNAKNRYKIIQTY